MKKLLFATALVVATVPAFAGDNVTSQSHSWGSYHWNRTTAQIAPPVHDNVSAAWDTYLNRAIADWNKSVYIESPQVESALSGVKRCASATGKIEVCNSTYGGTGWLGVAGISVSGGHIVKGYTKLNDTYYNTAKYDTYGWRAMVMCQEIGHDYGLGHVNENFDDPNTGSCMDYTSDPDRNDGSGNNWYPNQHDYDQLASMYSHAHAAAAPGIDDAVSSFASRTYTVEELLADAGQWGAPVRYDGNGRPNVFALHTGSDENGNDRVEITHVFWAPENPFDDRDRVDAPKTRD